MNAVKKFIVAMLVVLGLGIVFFIGYFVKSNANLKHDARIIQNVRQMRECLTMQISCLIRRRRLSAGR